MSIRPRRPLPVCPRLLRMVSASRPCRPATRPTRLPRICTKVPSSATSSSPSRSALVGPLSLVGTRSCAEIFTRTCCLHGPRCIGESLLASSSLPSLTRILARTLDLVVVACAMIPSRMRKRSSKTITATALFPMARWARWKHRLAKAGCELASCMYLICIFFMGRGDLGGGESPFDTLVYICIGSVLVGMIWHASWCWESGDYQVPCILVQEYNLF